MNTFLSRAVSVVAAIHTAVGVSLAYPVHPWSLALGGTGLLVCAVWNRNLPTRGSVRDVVFRGYVVPVTTAAAAYALVSLPDSWGAANLRLREFARELVLRTPVAAYFLAVAYAAMCAQRAKDEAPPRQPTYYR